MPSNAAQSYWPQGADARSGRPTQANQIPGIILRREIASVVASQTSKRIKLRFGGNKAYTDCKTYIQIPAIAPASLYEPYDARIMRGLANHETAHIRHTKTDRRIITMLRAAGAMAAANTLHANPGTDVDALIKGLTRDERAKVHIYLRTDNILEDYRIEREQSADYPGSFYNLSHTRSHVVRADKERIEDYLANPPQTPWTALASGQQTALLQGAISNGYPIAGVAQTLVDLMTNDVDPDAANVVLSMWPRVIAARTSYDIHHLAIELADRLMAIDEARKQDDGAGNDDNGDDADQKADRQGQGRGKPQANGSDKSGGTGNQQPGDNDGAGAGADREADDDNDGSNADGTDDGAPGDQQNTQTDAKQPGAGNQTGDQTSDQTSGSAGSDQAGGASDSRSSRSEKPGTTTPSAYGDTETASQTLDVSDVIKRILDIAAAAEEDSAGASEGEVVIDKGEIVGNPGCDDVTVSTITLLPEDRETMRTLAAEASHETRRLSAAVRSLLLSQKRRKVRRNLEDGLFDTGAITSIALGDGQTFKTIAERRQMAAAVLILIDRSGSMGGQPLKMAAQAAHAFVDAVGINRDVKIAVASYTTRGTVTVDIHKPFERAIRDAVPALGALFRLSMGTTPTGAALTEALAMMSARREPKRLVLLVTDGCPDDQASANAAAEAILAMGIKLVGIGIGMDGNMPITDWRNIASIDDLPAALVDVAKATI